MNNNILLVPIINRLIGVYNTVNLIPNLTFEDYYFFQNKISKRLKFIQEEFDWTIHTKERLEPLNDSMPYIKNG